MELIKMHQPTCVDEDKEYRLNRSIKYLNNVNELNKHLVDGKWQIIANLMFGRFTDIGKNQIYGTPELMYNYLYYANELAKAWFTYVYNPGKAVRFKIGKNWFETTGAFHPRYIGVGWATIGIKTSLILRDQEGLELFANIDLDTAMKDSGGSSILSEIHYLLYSVIAKGEGSHEEVYATYEAIEKFRDWEVYKKTIIDKETPLEVHKNTHKYYYENVGQTSFPEMKIYESIFRKDQVAYEDAVKKALLFHKEYYSRKVWNEINQQEDDYTLEPSGWWSLSISAACALAYDQGMKLENIASDYIPDWAITGDFSQFKLLLEEEV